MASYLNRPVALLYQCVSGNKEYEVKRNSIWIKKKILPNYTSIGTASGYLHPASVKGGRNDRPTVTIIRPTVR